MRELGWLCASAGIVFAATAACSSNDAASGTGALTKAPGATYWSAGVVPICWHPVNPQFQEQKAVIRAAVERTWMAVADITFTGWQTCLTTGSGVHARSMYGASTTAGVSCGSTQPLGTSCGNSGEGSGWAQADTSPYYDLHNSPIEDTYIGTTLNADSSYNIQDLEFASVHEYGHVLAFAHEYLHPWNYYTETYCPQGNEGIGVGLGLTDYDQQSIMSYCRAADDCTLTALDIQGAQVAYGKRALTADSDHDGRPDYLDNCPYVPNYDQADSNYESELQTAIDNGYQNIWGAKEGLPPSTTDTDDANGYVTHWRTWYSGDACDPTPVSIVQNVANTPTADLGPCIDVSIGGISSSSVDYNPKVPCPYTVNTGLTFNGIVSDANGGASSQLGRSGPSYCDCTLANDPNPINQAQCNDPTKTFQCLYGRDNLFPPFNNVPPAGKWGRITQYSPGSCTNKICAINLWLPFADVSTSFARPFWNYVSTTKTLVWDFGGTNYSPNDLTRYGYASTDMSMTGLLWSHVTKYATVPPENKANQYLPITAYRSFGARYHWTPPFAPKWHPQAWIDPGPLKWGPVTQVAYVPTAKSTMVVAMGVNGPEDISSRFTPAALLALRRVATGTTDLLSAAEKAAQPLPRSVTPSAILLGAGTTEIIGVLALRGGHIDFRAPSVPGTGPAVDPLWRAYSSEAHTLYSIEGSSLVARDVDAYLVGQGSPSSTAITGENLGTIQGFSYDPTTGGMDLLDVVGKPGFQQLRFSKLSTNAVATEVWRTQPPGFVPTTGLFLSTTINGEAIIGLPSAGQGFFEVIVFRPDGSPLLSYRGQGELSSAPLFHGDGVTLPLQRPTTAKEGNLDLEFARWSSMSYGLCATSWFRAHVGDQRAGVLGYPQIECP